MSGILPAPKTRPATGPGVKDDPACYSARHEVNLVCYSARPGVNPACYSASPEVNPACYRTPGEVPPRKSQNTRWRPFNLEDTDDLE